MVVADKFSLGSISISDYAVDGALGAAADTVDKASCFVITQTTDGVSISSIPTPTVNRGSQKIEILNSTSSTKSIKVMGVVLSIGSAISFIWNGATWSSYNDADVNASAKIFTVAQSLVNGANVVTHNLGLITPFKTLEVFVRNNATGESIANSLSLYSTNDVTVTVSLSGPTDTNILIIAK